MLLHPQPNSYTPVHQSAKGGTHVSLLIYYRCHRVQFLRQDLLMIMLPSQRSHHVERPGTERLTHSQSFRSHRVFHSLSSTGSLRHALIGGTCNHYQAHMIIWPWIRNSQRCENKMISIPRKLGAGYPPNAYTTIIPFVRQIHDRSSAMQCLLFLSGRSSVRPTQSEKNNKVFAIGMLPFLYVPSLHIHAECFACNLRACDCISVQTCSTQCMCIL